MPKLTITLPQKRPIIPCFIAIGRAQERALMAAGRPVPAAIAVKGFIDTGCDTLVLDHTLVEKLGLQAHSYTALRSAQGIAYAASFSARLTIQTEPEPTTFDDLPCVAFSNIQTDDFQVLLGRNVLEHFRIEFDGPESTLTLQVSPGRNQG